MPGLLAKLLRRSYGMRLLLVLVFAVVSVSIVHSQIERPFVKRITHAQGLSHDVTRSVIKDSDGFVWVSTENGLNRYDGYRFLVFKNIPSDSTSISGNQVYALCEDAHRNIWISGFNFLSRYNMDSHRFYNYPSNPSNANAYQGHLVKSFYLDQQQRLWLCTYVNGLALYRPETDDFRYFLPDSTMQNSNNNIISELVQTDGNNYWAASNSGLLQFDFQNQKFIRCIANPDRPENFSYYNHSISLYVDDSDKNVVWYGTWGSGLHAYNVSTGKTETYKYDENLPLNISNIVFDIAKRNDNSLWLCTEKGLMSFDINTHEFHLIQHETDNFNSISGGELQHIYIDKEGLIWLPGIHGLEIIDPLQQLFRPLVTDQKPEIYNMQWHEQSKSIVGVSLYVNRSLWMIDPNSGKSSRFAIPEADKKMHEPIGLCSLKDGRIVIGMIRMNPYIFNPANKQFKQIPLNSILGLDENKLDIRSLLEDELGNVWMANHKGGLILWRPDENTAIHIGGETENKPEAFKAPTNRVLQHMDIIYGFVPSAGLMRVNCNTQELNYLSFNDKILKKSAHVALDSDGHLWFTTPTNGLLECIVSDTLQILNIYYNELLDKDISNIYIDSNNLLWINASSGLICFNPKNKSSSLYTDIDGLYPYNSDFAMVEGENDHFYYLTSGVLGTFRQNDLLQPTKYYRTILSQFLAADKPILLETELSDLNFIELNPDQNNISFTLGALCYSGEEKQEFAYKLEGFDDNWHYIGSNHEGSYTNLPPGKYNLLLNSKYKGIPWSTDVTKIEVVIRPHYYQTWWFKVMVGAIVIALIVLVIRTYFQNKLRKANMELEKQKSIQSMRQRISRDIHDEIGAGLTKISLMSKQMEKSMGEEQSGKNHIQKINTTSRQLVQNLGEIVWTINPNNDTLFDLLSYLRRYFNEMAESTDIQFTLHLPEISKELQMLSVHPEVKRNLLLIIKESLNNAIKHSGASKIELEIIHTKNLLRATVKDNGKGFVMNEKETVGNGLRNMRKRAEDIGTILEIQTTSSGGTSVHIEISL